MILTSTEYSVAAREIRLAQVQGKVEINKYRVLSSCQGNKIGSDTEEG